MREQLIALLQQNARTSDAELAVMLGVTEAEVTAEIQKLEAEGVIKGYSAIVNDEIANKDMVTAIIELRVTPQRDCGYEEIAHTIMQYYEVESIALMAGAYDLSVTVKGMNVKEVSMFVSQRLAPLAGVLSTATYFVLKKYKEKGIIIEGEEKDERGYYFP
ncbi:Lrp/AsnC family transcriptional regulator [uncultured Ruminococcus sp.]|uniref:Lrp/AsnC family transcriptional regulator n=1 Tax=uncultured Ruminococcus sp. TaxID=165186 RepID=UPI0026367689|nr:Lrp/AsnC family transcriptional regulator [uncultured Ruminococcus sp.]